MDQIMSEKSVYKQIAVDLAQGIANGRFAVGMKIKGRSTLAGHYNVSPETVRRAVALLEAAKVVEVQPGTGVLVRSAERAQEFVNRFRDLAGINAIRTHITELMDQQQAINDELNKNVHMLLDAMDRFNSLTSLVLYELEIIDCPNHGKTIGELDIWRRTGVTIVAIRREGKTLLSPGAGAELLEGDVLLLVGDDGSYRKTRCYLYGKSEEEL